MMIRRSTNPVEFNRRKLQVFGRLRDGVSLEQARAEMDAVAVRLRRKTRPRTLASA